MTFHLGRWIRSTDWYPDYQLRLYDRRRARWAGRYVHESVQADGPVGQLRGELQHYPYRDIAHHLQTMDRYTTLAARQMFEDGRRAGWIDILVHAAAGVLPQLHPARRLSRRHARTRHLGDERVLRRPQIREALGAVFALHIDTARTWRGGQNQVLLTVLGLRALGHRAVLVAHAEGELYRRASEGPDLVPLAPRNEVDLSAAWKLSRIIRQFKPQIVHAHDPHAVAMAGLALSFGAPEPRPRSSRHAASTFICRGTRSRGGSTGRWICSSPRPNAIRDILEHDGIEAKRIVVVHDGIDVAKIGRLPAVDIHAEFWLPHGAPVLVNVGALVRHKGQKFLVEAMPHVLHEVPDAHLVIFGEGELRAALERQIKELHLEKHVLLAGFREDVLQLMKSADLFVMSSVTEGLGSTVLDAMAMKLAVVGTRAGGIPEAVVHGETGLLVAPAEPRELAAAIVRLLKDPALRARMGDAGLARVTEQFGVGRMLEGR